MHYAHLFLNFYFISFISWEFLWKDFMQPKIIVIEIKIYFVVKLLSQYQYSTKVH